MPPVLRLGCAGLVLIVIAALTSIGLYAVVAGQVVLFGAMPRPPSSIAPLLVTIQASTSTPAPAATPGAIDSTSPSAATLPPSAAAPATASAAAPPATASAAAPAPAAAATPVERTTPLPTPGLPRRATHEGLTVEIVDVDRAWRPGSEAQPVGRARTYLTVHVRLTNGVSEIRHVAAADLVLAADDGTRYAPRSAGPIREPALLSLPVLGGDSVRGWLTYDVSAGPAPSRLQWSPTQPDRPRADAAYAIGLSP